MSDAASFDAIMQCNLLEVFCEALGAAVLVTDKLDEISFASVRLLHFFPIAESAIAPGTRARDLYGALHDAGCRFGTGANQKDKKRDDWVAERVALAWKERVDTIEQHGSDRWYRVVSRRFGSGLGLTIIQDVSEHKKKEIHWRNEQDRVRMTEEILDTLPVAVAIKDRNLNFAAVNQQFCKMLRIGRESVLGKGIWDIFEPSLAASLEEADWRLLATGDDRECVIKVDRPERGPTSFLHRARRIGKPGQHFVSMSFDEYPVNTGNEDWPVAPDLVLKAGTASAALERQTDDVPEARPASTTRSIRRVAHIDPTNRAQNAVVDVSEKDTVEICVLTSEAEFSAFLPALREAGLRLDLVTIDAQASYAFPALAAAHGVRHIILPGNADILASACRALNIQPAVIQAEDGEVAAGNMPARSAASLDVLAIEDNPINRMALEQILESLGLSFAVFVNGQDALGRIAELNPRIIFSDTTLPDIQLSDIVPALSAALEDMRRKPSIVALVASDSPEHRQTLKQIGFSDAIAKPLSPDAVDQVIRTHLLAEKGAGRGPMAAA